MKEPLPYCITEKAIKGYCDSNLAKLEKNDCVVRAFASCFSITYDKAHKYVEKQFNRKKGKGTYFTFSKMGELVKNKTEINHKKLNYVGNKRNDGLGYTLKYPVKVKGNEIMRNMTVGTFVKQNPRGTYFILIRCHALTIKDGTIIGNLEDSRRKRAVIKHAFKVN